MAFVLNECWGNPSSIHHMGVLAKEELDNARKTVARLLSCRDDEIFFTSGGTESNNIAVFYQKCKIQILNLTAHIINNLLTVCQQISGRKCMFCLN